MKKIYDLSVMLEENPEYAKKIQALTLNEAKPFLGLKGVFGLFGSTQWWDNIKNKVTPQEEIEGVITKIYRTGQDNTEQYNTIEILCDNKKTAIEGMYANKKSDKALYKPGAKIKIKYIIEPLKDQPASDGSQNNIKTVLEVYLSTQH